MITVMGNSYGEGCSVAVQLTRNRTFRKANLQQKFPQTLELAGTV